MKKKSVFFLKYEVSILIWYIICVDIFINKIIINVYAMKSDVLKIDKKNITYN